MKKKREKQKLISLKTSFNHLMSTEKSLVVKEKTYTLRPGRLGLFAVAFILILVILANLFSIPSKKLSTIDMEFGAGGRYYMVTGNKDIIMHNNQGIKSVNKKGDVRWEVKRAATKPMTEVSGNYLLSADLDGNHTAILYKDGKVLNEFNLGSDIISAEVNKNGDVIIATSTSGYKGKITVFDKKGRERFIWNSGDGYITDVAIHENGRHIAVAQLTSTEAQAGSNIQFIDLNRKKVINTSKRSNTIISEILFSNDRLLSVSDVEFCGYSKGGNLKFEVSFAGKKPGKYDISNNNLFSFVTIDNRGGEVLEIYNIRGKLKGSYSSDSTINSIATCDEGVMLSTRRDILYVNKRGKLKKSVTSNHDIKSLGLFGDGKTVMALGSESADVVRMR